MFRSDCTSGLCLVLWVAGAATGLGCGDTIIDARCVPDHPSYDAAACDEATESGSGSSGSGSSGSGTAGSGTSSSGSFPEPAQECGLAYDAPNITAGWRDVFPILVAPDKGNCSAAGCHGDESTAANGIWLPADDELALYNTLIHTTGSVGRPYVNPDSPHESWIHCNVQGARGGGLLMPAPAGLPTIQDIRIIEDWVYNGVVGP